MLSTVDYLYDFYTEEQIAAIMQMYCSVVDVTLDDEQFLWEDEVVGTAMDEDEDNNGYW